MTELTFQHPERLWLTALIILVALGLLIYGYKKSPLRGASRWVALVCKAAAWAILALCLTDPVWSRRLPKTGENEVIVVADNSASLNISEMPGSLTRAEQMSEALGKSSSSPPSWLEELGQMFRVKTELADERLQSVADFSKLNFQGTKSELNRALGTLRNGGPSSRVAAIVLISDGNPTDAPADEIKVDQSGPQVPIFSVLVGRDTPKPDLVLVDQTVSQTAFEDTPVTITARVAGHGYEGKDIAVCVLDETGKTVVIEKLRLSKDEAAQAVRLRLPVVKPGVSFYQVVVMEASLVDKIAKDEWKQLSKEATLANNVRHLAVDRGAGPYRILYVSGRPNWEYKFLRRALAADSEIQMPSLIRIAKREPKFEWRGRTGETSNPLFRGFGQQGEAQRYDQPVLTRLGTKDAKELSDGFPKSEEELFGEYRAIIIDDLEAEFFTQEQMNLMERFVSERGGALLMLGGQESYQAGGYAHTPVGRMLPVYLDQVTQAPAIENGRLNLTREGWLEPWTRLRANREEDEQRLAQMPGFYSVNQTFSIKPGASILATISNGDEGNALPALAAQRFGEGRVVALTIADMWRWGMRDEEAAKDLQRSWRQLMRWLVVDVPDRIQITATSDAERIKLEVRVKDRAFHSMDDAMVKIEITSPDGKKSSLFGEPSLKEAGLFEAEFFPRESGAYRATAEVQATNVADAVQTSAILGTKTTGWVHDPLPAEYAVMKPGRDWMERIAQESGGQMLMLSELSQLPELMKNIRVPVEETVTEPLWHAPWVFALVLALLSLEWVLRRKGGMA